MSPFFVADCLVRRLLSISPRRGCLGAALALALMASAAWGQVADPVTKDWTFSYSGFGTLGAVHHGDTNVEFRRDLGQADGVKANRAGLSPDSNLGLQLTARYHREFESSMQVVSRKNANGDYGPDVAWAFVKYRPEENLALRLGRLGYEMYMQGDAAEIGYANLLVRQQVIFYPRTFDGMDIEWTTPVGKGVVRAKGQAGWALGKIVSGLSSYDTAGSLGRGVILEYMQGAWTGRVAGGALSLRDDMTDPYSVTLRNSLKAYALNSGSIIDRLSMKNRTIDYVSAAMAYDSDALQGSFSLSRETSNGWPARDILFGNVGYRVGPCTPYLGFSIQHTDRKVTAAVVPAWIPPANAAMLDTASGIAQAGQIVNQSDLAVGVRYDLAQNMALKLQLDRIRYRDPEALVDASLATTRFQDRQYKAFNLFSVALDFVF